MPTPRPFINPGRRKGGDLALPCGTVIRSLREWRQRHWPYCGICVGNYGESPYVPPQDDTSFT